MNVWEVVAVACAGLIAYFYVGYPVLIFVLAKLFGTDTEKRDIEPTVALLISAYNEEKDIARKIENSLALDYPREKLEIIVGSDGSTDRTCEIVRRYEDVGVKLLAFERNRGKASLQNDLAAAARSEVLVFSDATGMYARENARQIVRHFADERVGCVCGVVRQANARNVSTADAVSVHARSEAFVRQMEQWLEIMHSGSGSIIAIRRSDFASMPPDVSEDLCLPLTACLAERRCVMETKAVSVEVLPRTLRELLRTTARTASLDITTLWRCRATFAFWRRPLLAFGVASHRLLRYAVPLLWFGLLAGCLLSGRQTLRIGALVAISGVALAAALGNAISATPVLGRVSGLVRSYVVWNAAVCVGWSRLVLRRSTGRWVPGRI